MEKKLICLRWANHRARFLHGLQCDIPPQASLIWAQFNVHNHNSPAAVLDLPIIRSIAPLVPNRPHSLPWTRRQNSGLLWNFGLLLRRILQPSRISSRFGFGPDRQPDKAKFRGFFDQWRRPIVVKESKSESRRWWVIAYERPQQKFPSFTIQPRFATRMRKNLINWGRTNLRFGCEICPFLVHAILPPNSQECERTDSFPG